MRTDGPIGGPNDRIDEIMAHVDAGCVVYGGSGATEDGTPVFYVGGGSRRTGKHLRARHRIGVVGLPQRFIGDPGGPSSAWPAGDVRLAGHGGRSGA